MNSIWGSRVLNILKDVGASIKISDTKIPDANIRYKNP